MKKLIALSILSLVLLSSLNAHLGFRKIYDTSCEVIKKHPYTTAGITSLVLMAAGTCYLLQLISRSISDGNFHKIRGLEPWGEE